jgi:hypothetical protein
VSEPWYERTTLGIIDALARDELAELQVMQVARVWGQLLAGFEDERAEIVADLADLNARNGEISETLKAMEPTLARALSKTMLKGQVGVWTNDPEMRREHPDADQLLRQRERLEKSQEPIKAAIGQHETRLKTLDAEDLPRWRQNVATVEEALARKQAKRQAEAQAVEQYEQRSLRERAADGARRLVGRA